MVDNTVSILIVKIKTTKKTTNINKKLKKKNNFKVKIIKSIKIKQIYR